MRSSASSTTDITGRLFTNALIAYTGGNGRPVNTQLEVVTLDGFRYQVATRGLDPNGFAFYGNQVGFLDGDGATPLYHDAYGTTSSSELTGLAGGVTLAAPTFPIFFGAPAAATLAALAIPTTPVAPVISSVTFAGNISGNTSSLGAGGTFTYSANVGGVYQIVISRDGVNFDPGAAQNRVLRGVRTSGTQTVAWDGKDNSGADFPVGAGYAVRASLHAGEYHFPLLDAENSTLGGPSVTLLNPPGGVCPGGSCTTGYFDDRGYRTLGSASATVGPLPPPDAPLCGTAPPAAPQHSDPVTGYDTTSTLRAYGTDTNGNTNVPCTGSFGDVKGLDNWTYFPSTVASNSLDIVDSADVSVTKAHTGSFTVGTNGTFTLTVANAGPGTSGALTVTDALPAGLGFVSGTGAGWTCGAVGSTITCTNSTGLASGGSTAIALTVSVAPAAAPSTTNTATVSAVRADPNTANNSSSDPVSVTPIPLAVDDTASTPEGTPVTIGVTANDNLGATPTTITSHTAPAHGSVTCTASGCTYTPAAGFAGIDTFHYTITDANSRTSTATVTITVTIPPTPAGPAPPPTGGGTTPAPADADLATTVHGPARVSPGSVVKLVATVRNNGTGSAAGSQVTLTLPAGFTVRPGTIAIDSAAAGSACVVGRSLVHVSTRHSQLRRHRSDHLAGECERAGGCGRSRGSLERPVDHHRRRPGEQPVQLGDPCREASRPGGYAEARGSDHGSPGHRSTGRGDQEHRRRLEHRLRNRQGRRRLCARARERDLRVGARRRVSAGQCVLVGRRPRRSRLASLRRRHACGYARRAPARSTPSLWRRGGVGDGP